MAKKTKISVNSVRSLNMANLCYLKVHREMYIIYKDSDKVTYPRLYLSMCGNPGVFLSVTESVAREFSNYEMSFDVMLDLYSILCEIYGQTKLPF